MLKTAEREKIKTAILQAMKVTFAEMAFVDVEEEQAGNQGREPHGSTLPVLRSARPGDEADRAVVAEVLDLTRSGRRTDLPEARRQPELFAADHEK